MGYGGAVLDKNGTWISGFSSSVVHGNAFHAELLADENGLKLAWYLGHRNVMCNTYCHDVVHVLATTIDISTFWEQDLITKIRVMLCWGWFVEVQHIPRDHNLVADALMRQASSDGSPYRVWRIPPSNVMAFLCLNV